MEIPNAVTSVRIERIAHFIVKRVEVAIDGERSVGVVGWDQIGHGTGRNPQSSAYCPNKPIISPG